MRASTAAAAAVTLALALLLALPGQALAQGPTWELLAIHAPTNVPLQASANQLVTLTEHGNVGKYSLAFSNEATGETGETAWLPFDATAVQVQRALEKLKHGEPKTAVGKGNVAVQGGYDAETSTGTYTVEFTAALGDRHLGDEPEAPVEFSESEVTGGEEAKFEREEEKRGGSAEPEEPEGEVAQTTAGYQDTIDYRLMPANRTATASSGAVRLIDELPAGVRTAAMPGGAGWQCEKPRGQESEKEVEKEKKAEEQLDKEEKLPEGAGLSAVECSYAASVNADGSPPPLGIEATLEVAALGGKASIEDTASVQPPGAAEQTVHETAPLGSTPAAFGVQSFAAAGTDAEGNTYTQAGGHPYADTTGLFFNTVPRVEPVSKDTEIAVSGRVKDVDVKLPAGFVGNPLAVARCSQAQFMEGVPGGPDEGGSCPPDAQVGIADVFIGYFLTAPEPVAVYDLVPPAGVPAEFGFIFKNVPVRLDAQLIHEAAGGGEYRVTVTSADINEAYNVFGVALTLWGVPAAASHTPERFKGLVDRGAPYEGEERPFLTNPGDCSAEAEALQAGSPHANLAPLTAAAADSWERPGALDAQGDPESPGANWSEAQATSPAVTGCAGESLGFHPAIGFAARSGESEGGAAAGTTQADSPSGYRFELTIPQDEAVGGLATPELRDATVSLPEGLVLSPSAANGLQACTENEIDLESTTRGSCPEASQIGSVTIQTPLLEQPLPGRVYVGEPECSPCSAAQVGEGKLLKLYIEAEEAGAPEGAGVRVKLRGTDSVNQQTGQSTTTFANNPQLPFEKLTLTLKGGPRAALANPQGCAEGLSASALLTPWDVTTAGGETLAGMPAPAPISSSPFNVTGCLASLPFDPSLSAGTENANAGQYSSFAVTFSRNDGEQDLSAVTVTMPPGLLGKIAGIPRCEGEAAESATVECPSASQLGTATSAAGVGDEPYVVSGPVYLTGGYEGAPFGLKVAVPANAGPFHLGTVVVRAKISVNPVTSAISVTSQPLPQSIDGIPFRLKTVRVDVDRPEFIFNPTNCETLAISASLTGQPANAGEGAVTSSKSVPFTADHCGALTFAPRFSASTEAHWSKKDGASFTVRVTQRPGEAHIHKVEVELPERLPSRQETLTLACTEAQFAANPSGCPEASVVGTATAHTPLLAAALSGPAYLVSHGGAAFPDLVFLLQGEGVHIELVGKTDIKNIGGKEVTFSKFETVPDAPVSSFETVLPEGPHSILGAYTSLCAGTLSAPTTIIAQNNMRMVQNTKIAVVGCPPTVSITGTRVRGGRLLVTVKLSQAGTVTLSGTGVAPMRKGLAAGSHTLSLALNGAGRKAARGRRTFSIRATLTAGHEDGSATAKVKV